jgi:large-conductance mechanosensitive channel
MFNQYLIIMDVVHFITCLLCACALAFLIYQISELIKAFKEANKKDDEELMWEEVPEHLHSLNEARKLIKEKRKKEGK